MADLIFEFITDRQGYVEVNRLPSTFFRFHARCPQGNICGPRVFNIYSSDLGECITNDHVWLTTYADDSYMTVSCDPDKSLLEVMKETMSKHGREWPCVQHWTNINYVNQLRTGTNRVWWKKIQSTDTMKVLGRTFDSRLDWGYQISNTISKCSRTLHGLRNIGKFLSTSQFKQIITVFFFSVFNYGMEIWFHQNLGFHYKRWIRALHYKALGTVYILVN